MAAMFDGRTGRFQTTGIAPLRLLRHVLSGRCTRVLAAALLMVGSAAADERDAPDAGVLAALEHGLRPTLLAAGAQPPGWSLRKRMDHHGVPGVAIAVVRDGRVVEAAGYGVREAGTSDAIDADTLFSVGSISKMVAAATTLRLVASGTLDLDRDVNTYLESWRIPEAPAFPGAQVTLRMLMSHTSGLTVWGFDDYLPGETLPSIVETLDGRPPAKNGPVRLDFRPGTRMRYSGGGATVEQLVLEDVADQPLEAIADAEVFAPLGMRRSTFVNPVPPALGNIAKAHDETGAPAALPRGWEAFPEQAASGLWTSANDLGAFVGALIGSYRSRSDFLPRAVAMQMMTEVAPSVHGLGPRLEGTGAARIFHHGGSNDSYRAWIEGHLETGDGLVILTNGNGGGRLTMEIRNALTDALGTGINPPVRAIAVDPASSGFADYNGTYRLEAAASKHLHGNLSGYFESDVLDVAAAEGLLTVSERSKPMTLTLQPLSPTRFIGPGDYHQLNFEFHRDAHGVVSGLTVDRGSARLHYRRDGGATASL